jgi:ubiquinone/menaquinone biosynthesis C-methylase UbiE
MDWAAYDTIAGRYDEVWGKRFEIVAQLIWERVSPPRGAAILDIGTGTGIVLHALGPRLGDVASVTACDRSTEMMRVARSPMPGLRVVAADATSLPFHDQAFDQVTASFVLSHLPDHEAGLREMRRVLRPGGRAAVTSWAVDTDAHAALWRGLLADVVSKERLEAAVARVAPSESRVDSPTSLERTLARTGFAAVDVHSRAVDSRMSLDEFLADRELTSAARYVRHALGEEGWRELVVRARAELGRRFGPEFTFSRGVLIGVGLRDA